VDGIYVKSQIFANATKKGRKDGLKQSAMSLMEKFLKC